MKWLFLGLLLLALPVLSNLYRTDPRSLRPIAFAIGFLPFVMAPWHLIVAPISWSMWPGYVKGLEVTALDALALAILLGSKRGIGSLVPFKFLFGAYIAIILFTAIQTSVPMASIFYAWQIFRMFIICWAVVTLCQDERAISPIIFGMAIGLAIQAVLVVNEHSGGALQPSGSFGHQNLLGMLSHFAVFSCTALILAGTKKQWLAVLGAASGLVIVIFGASRGTIGLAAIGYAILFALSMMRRPTARKSAILGAAIAVFLAAAPFVAWSLSNRFAAAPLSEDYDERAAFEKAARLMIAGHPFGVGANQYVIIVNAQGYADRAGVAPIFGSRSATVHNVYLLSTAETSLLGAISLIMLLVAPVILALKTAWRFKADKRGEILVGLATAIIVVALQSFYEWVFVTSHVQNLFAIAVGVIVGLSRLMVRERRAKAVAPGSADEIPVPAAAL